MSDHVMRWFAVQVAADELLRENHDWRRGQALFNALYRIDRHLADQIRGTVADPFYDNSRIQAFGEAVMRGAA